MQSDYYINLHFNQAVAQRTGYAFKIGDKGCTFHLHCEDLDPSDMFPHIVFNHPNNTCVEGVPEGSGRDYEYTIQGNEFGVCGKTVVDLKFYDNNNDATQRISTASFMIEIIPDTYTPFDEASSSYADSLERAREEIDAAIVELEGAERDLDDMSGQFADTLQDYIDAFGNTAPINPCGEYDLAEPYVPRDAVEYTAGGKTLTYINRSACTGIAPTDPDHGAEHWQIMIDVAVGGSFSALSDVSVDPQTLADGQVPVYDDTDDVWKNKTILENSLTSTATDKALTAAKGKELQDNKQPKELETPITIAGTQETTTEGALGALNTAKQGTTLDTAITIDGTSKTTVETALSGLNAYSDKLKGLLSNENLFDNPWFTVNQRGISGTHYEDYMADRWDSYGFAGTLITTNTLSNGIRIQSGSTEGWRAMQNIENYKMLSGKVVTFSINIISANPTPTVFLYSTSPNGSNGTWLVIGTSTTTGILSFTFTLPDLSSATGLCIALQGVESQDITIRAVKLELGSVSTLALDVAPDYTTELLKCQRYYFRNTSTENYAHIAIGTAMSTTSVYIVLPIPVPMRTTPTFAYAGSLSFMTNGSDVSVSSVTAYPKTDHTCLLVLDLASSVTAGASGSVHFSTSGSYYELKADL